MEIKCDKGITMIALVITIIVLMILVGISIMYGTNVISSVKEESIITNMITIKAKAKIIAEEVNAQVWASDDDSKKAEFRKSFNANDEYSLLSSEQIEDIGSQVKYNNEFIAYLLVEDVMKKMGLTGISNPQDYVVVYNLKDYTKLDIIYLPGVNKNNVMHYSLSELQ